MPLCIECRKLEDNGGDTYEEGDDSDASDEDEATSSTTIERRGCGYGLVICHTQGTRREQEYIRVGVFFSPENGTGGLSVLKKHPREQVHLI